ncbi:MAG: hypothetical protein P8123_05850 [bacterium]
MSELRTRLTPEQRTEQLSLTIDPGFVHHRKIQTIIGSAGMNFIDEGIRQLPATLPDWTKDVRIDHIYTDVLLAWCKIKKVKSLSEFIIAGDNKIFCST